MANVIHASVIDAGLAVIVADASDVYLVSQDPANFEEATVTYALGRKNFGAGNAVTGPSAGAPNGRKVTVAQITDGSVTGDGTATGWALVDTAGQILLANGDLSQVQAVENGNTFQLPAFDISQPNQ